MYQELINQINPKPIFNLKWYHDEDLYSEGEIEDIIIEMIANNEGENYTDAIYGKYSWSTFYHLTHIRKNILNWYPFLKDADVLEIGCGMGSITNMLCEKCKNVTAVELSKKRATATLLRCKDKSNLEIIVGNLNDIEFEKKYDYITLIGVLEYQGSYTDSDNPYKDFLKKIKGLLKPNGKLLIAIENQYGLKYWCGAREDHTGIPFEGLNQYGITDKKVRTFSKEALRRLILESGFADTYFYYPMPDYKLPEVIYSQDVLPKNGNMENMDYYYVPDGTTMIASEAQIYQDIIENNTFEFFANSFLVECSNGTNQDAERVTFAKLSCLRYPEYRVGTRFINKERVERFGLDKKVAHNHLQQLMINENNLRQRGIKVCDADYTSENVTLAFRNQEVCDDLLLKAVHDNDIEEFYRVLDCVYADIKKSSDTVSPEQNVMFSLKVGDSGNTEKYGDVLKTGYLDMIPRNAFWEDDSLVWFDQEWTLENVPVGFVMYRLITELYFSYPKIANILPLETVVARYHLTEAWEDYDKLNNLFMASVADQKVIAEFFNFKKVSGEDYIRNIKKIMNL